VGAGLTLPILVLSPSPSLDSEILSHKQIYEKYLPSFIF